MAAKRKPKTKHWCPTCRNSGYVDAPAKAIDGRLYTFVARCPDCTSEKPAIVLERGQLPLDHQERAAGERRE